MPVTEVTPRPTMDYKITDKKKDSTMNPALDYSGFDAEENAARTEYDEKVKSLQALMPKIDYETLFAPYMKHLNAQPTTHAPGKMESFARAFSSQEGKQDVMSQMKLAHQESTDKQDKLLESERNILEMKAKQETARGEADKALKTTQALKELEMKLGHVKNKRDMAEWEHKHQIETADKKALQDSKLNAADRIARARIKAAVTKAGGDQKVLLAVMKMYNDRALITMKARLNADPDLGLSMTDEEVADMTLKSMGEIESLVTQAKKDAGIVTGGSSSAPVIPPPEKSTVADKYRKAAQEIDAERKKPK